MGEFFILNAKNICIILTYIFIVPQWVSQMNGQFSLFAQTGWCLCKKNHSVVCTWWNTLKYARQSVVQFVICVCFIQVNNVKTVFWDWSYYTPMFSLSGFILCLYWFFCRKLYWDLPRQLLTPQPLLSWKPRPLPVLRTTLPARTESSLRPPSVPWPRRSSWPALKWAMLSH